MSGFGYLKHILADSKILFHRKSAAEIFKVFSASRAEQEAQSERVNFTLEPLQVSYSQLDIYKDIDAQLVVKSTLHHYRKCFELRRFIKSSLIEPLLMLDIVTTIKIESCATFDSIDETFFVGCASLKHLLVSGNPMLKRLPAKLSAENSPIEYLELDRNRA